MNTTTTEKTGEGNAPRVELKNVKYAAFASHETSCFSATVYINGNKEGSVENDGNGGCNFYNPFGLQDKLRAIAETLPDIQFDEQMLKQDADILIGDLLNAYLQKRDLKRLCSKKTLFRIKTETYREGEYRTVKAPWSDKVKTYLLKKYGETLDEILNEQLA